MCACACFAVSGLVTERAGFCRKDSDGSGMLVALYNIAFFFHFLLVSSHSLYISATSTLVLFFVYGATSLTKPWSAIHLFLFLSFSLQRRWITIHSSVSFYATFISLYPLFHSDIQCCISDFIYLHHASYVFDNNLHHHPEALFFTVPIGYSGHLEKI